VSAVTITPEEREAVFAEWRRLAAEPRPRPRQPWGCAVVVIAVLVFLFAPQLPLPGWLQTTLRWMSGFGIALGLFFQFGLVSSKYSHDSRRANDSIDWLAASQDTTDSIERRRHAVTLLRYAITDDDGPTTSSTVDLDDARKRLGVHLPYVLAVDRLLAEEKAAGWKVFG
jgi:hypothetical protein